MHQLNSNFHGCIKKVKMSELFFIKINVLPNPKDRVIMGIFLENIVPFGLYANLNEVAAAFGYFQALISIHFCTSQNISELDAQKKIFDKHFLSLFLTKWCKV